MSSGDNSNILSARVARETFGVENVVARIYDPRRAEVYERLGIPTVATVRWTADQMLRRLMPGGGHAGVDRPERSDHPRRGADRRQLDRAATHQARGRRPAPASACVIRFGEGMLPEPGTALQDGDTVHLLLDRHSLNAVEKAVAAGPDA